jgi:enoyl-[acyl-carrier protein] reductase II
MKTNRICKLLAIQYPIVQAGMIWTSGWRLAAAAAEAGALGLIGSASMYPDVLREHIRKCKQATRASFGVNVALLYPDIDKIMDILVEEGVKIVFTSAGNPATWTPFLKEKGVTVVHVISSSRFAKKAEAAGADAEVAEGFEAGGHNGREETTTMCLLPLVCEAVKIPVIAAGGIGTGKAMCAAFALGAEGVQVGTRFAMTEESSLHPDFKSKLLETKEGDTVLTLKQLTPVRLVKNKFYEQVKAAESRGASPEELKTLLGRARAKRGMFEGDLDEGELEIGQVASQVHAIRPAAEVVKEIWEEFEATRKGLGG